MAPEMPERWWKTYQDLSAPPHTPSNVAAEGSSTTGTDKCRELLHTAPSIPDSLTLIVVVHLAQAIFQKVLLKKKGGS